MNYIVGDPTCSRVKIGYTKGTRKQLWNRYYKDYGSDMIMYLFYNNDYIATKYKFLQFFQEYNLTNDLFCAKHIDQYIQFLQNFGELIVVEQSPIQKRQI